MKFNVHLYPVVRVSIKVEANSPEEAAKIANKEIDYESAIKAGDFTDSVDGAVVDTLDAFDKVVSSTDFSSLVF